MRASLEDNVVGESPKKEKIFRLLESFFIFVEETSEVTDLLALFELAKASETHESYVHLLKKLTSSSNDIPGSAVGSLPTTHDHALTAASSESCKKTKEAIESKILPRFDHYNDELEALGIKVTNWTVKINIDVTIKINQLIYLNHFSLNFIYIDLFMSMIFFVWF